MKKAVLVFLLILNTSTSFAGAVYRNKLWVGGDIDSQLAAAQNLRFNLLLQSRFGDNESKFEQQFIQPAIYYLWAPRLSFWLGYSYIPTVPNNQVSALLEQRIWPQVVYGVKVGSSSVATSRTRLETRWREGSSQVSERLRERIEFSTPLPAHSSVTFDVFNEVYFNVRKAEWVAPGTFDQNRIYIGLGFTINPQTVFDIGYINIFRLRSPQNQIDNVAVMGVSINLQKVDVDTIEII